MDDLLKFINSGVPALDSLMSKLEKLKQQLPEDEQRKLDLEIEKTRNDLNEASKKIKDILNKI